MGKIFGKFVEFDFTTGFQMWDSDKSNKITFKAPAVLSPDYSLTWPSAQGGVNTYLKNDGSGNLSWDSGAGGITWATPVNANIIPDGNETRSAGDGTNQFLNMRTRNLISNSDLDISAAAGNLALTATGGATITAGGITLDAGSGSLELYGAGGVIQMATPLTDQVLANAGITIDTSTTQPTAAVGHRGQIWVVRGGVGVADDPQMCIKDDTDTYVWTSLSGGGGGANTALSNLASTAVNTNINPGVDGTHSLGNATFSWLNVRTYNLFSNADLNIASNGTALVTLNSNLIDFVWGNSSSGAIQLNTSGRVNFFNSPLENVLLPNATFLKFRNAGNTTNINAVGVRSDDILELSSGGNGNNGVEFSKHAAFVDNQFFIQDGNIGDIYPYDTFPVPTGVDLAAFVRYFSDSSTVYFGTASSDAEMDAASNGTANVRFGTGDNADGSTMNSPRHTGDALYKTGDNPLGTGRTGNQTWQTGSADGGNSGGFAFTSGDSTGGNSGNFTFMPGTAGLTQGRFGIGTTSPLAMLHVENSTTGTAYFKSTESAGQIDVLTLDSNGNTVLLLKNVNTPNGMFIGNSGGPTTDWQFANLDVGNIIFYTAGQGRLTLADDGNVIFNAASYIEFNQATALSFVIESGNTASRPGTPVLGQNYFDTQLAAGAGKPIWYNGTNWVDATGTTV